MISLFLLRLRVWSHKFGLALPSGVSPLILNTRLKPVLRYKTSLTFPAFQTSFNQTFTQLHADGNGPVILKIALIPVTPT